MQLTGALAWHLLYIVSSLTTAESGTVIQDVDGPSRFSSSRKSLSSSLSDDARLGRDAVAPTLSSSPIAACTLLQKSCITTFRCKAGARLYGFVEVAACSIVRSEPM
jgi:hypothetical protein